MDFDELLLAIAKRQILAFPFLEQLRVISKRFFNAKSRQYIHVRLIALCFISNVLNVNTYTVLTLILS